MMRYGEGDHNNLADVHDVIITPLLRQNDVVTSFRRNNEVIITSSVRWVNYEDTRLEKVVTQLAITIMLQR